MLHVCFDRSSRGVVLPNPHPWKKFLQSQRGTRSGTLLCSVGRGASCTAENRKNRIFGRKVCCCRKIVPYSLRGTRATAPFPGGWSFSCVAENSVFDHAYEELGFRPHMKKSTPEETAQ